MKALMKAPVLALAVLCAGAALAQTPTTNAHASRMDNLAIVLDLSAAQKAQVQTILQGEHVQMKQLWDQVKSSGTKPDFQAMRAAHQQINQDALQKLSGVLSAAQLKKFQALQQMGHRHFGHRGGPGAAGAASGAPASQN
jgi:hypothetical protein